MIAIEENNHHIVQSISLSNFPIELFKRLLSYICFEKVRNEYHFENEMFADFITILSGFMLL